MKMATYTTDITLEHDGPVGEAEAEGLLDAFGADGVGVESTEGSPLVRVTLRADADSLGEAGKRWDDLTDRVLTVVPGWRLTSSRA